MWCRHCSSHSPACEPNCSSSTAAVFCSRLWSSHTTACLPARPCSCLRPGNYQPTPTHHFIRLLHDKGLLLRCFTQNIDSLEHQVWAAWGAAGHSAVCQAGGRGVGPRSDVCCTRALLTPLCRAVVCRLVCLSMRWWLLMATLTVSAAEQPSVCLCPALLMPAGVQWACPKALCHVGVPAHPCYQ